MSSGLGILKGTWVGLLLAGLPSALWAPPAAGQVGSTVTPSRPSDLSTSTLSRSLGRFRPNDPMSFETNRSVASVSPGELAGPTLRHSRGAARNTVGSGFGSGSPGRNSLLGRTVNRGSGQIMPGAGGWGNPGGRGWSPARSGPLQTGLLIHPPDDGGDTLEPRFVPELPAGTGSSMSDWTRSYVSTRRETYLAQGWAYFREGQYRAATDMFNLAAAVSTDNPQDLSECKLALLHAAVASRQLVLAASIVRWFITDDPRTGQIRDPDVLRRLRDVESLYGIRSDYLEHVSHVNSRANHEHATLEAKALRAVVLWGQNDKVRAQYYARELAAPGVASPWPRLLGLMQRADQATAPSATGLTGLLVPIPSPGQWAGE